MLRRPTSRAPWPVFAALAVAGLLGGVGLAAFLSLPRVAVFSPTSGAHDVSSLAPLRLSFNLPMDPASVEAALTVIPAQAGQFSWESNTLIFTPAKPWPLGAAVTVQLVGGQSLAGLPLLGQHIWTFAVAERRMAYLAGAVPNLWLIPVAAGAEPRQITTEPFGVYDYGVSPDGARFVYAARRADGGADLRVVNVDGTGAADLLLCPDVGCVSPVFAPDGRRVAYERRALIPSLTGEMSLGGSRVYVRALGAGVDEPVGDPAADTRFPRWGPDGRLSYLDTTRQAMVIYDLASGAVTYVPDSSGEMGTWSPDGTVVVYPEIFIPPEPTPAPGTEGDHMDRFFSRLLSVTIVTNEAVNLSGEGVVDDASPVYAPSGEWLAFGRRALGAVYAATWTPGRQLWLMRPDGSDAHALTQEPLYNHSAFAWNPEGTALAYMRFNAADPGAPAEIWVVNVEAAGPSGAEVSSARKLASGYLPEWLP